LNKSSERKRSNQTIQDELQLDNPEVIPVIYHKKKGEILKLLIEKEITIIELSHATGMNPGTVKRHLTDLQKYNLVFISRERVNEFSIVMKYYRASARNYLFNFKWP